jgi:hypothetical protein
VQDSGWKVPTEKDRSGGRSIIGNNTIGERQTEINITSKVYNGQEDKDDVSQKNHKSTSSGNRL